MVPFLCAFFLLLFGSCGKSQPNSPQNVKLSITSDPTMLDPRRARDLDSITLIHMLFEGLTRVSREGKTELAIADDVEVSLDGLRYVFHLRKSFWSNGAPLTASDFSASWRMILDPKFATDIAYQLYPIKNARKAKLGEIGLDAVGVQVLDEATLAVELEQPLPYFLELVSMASFFPVPTATVSQNGNWCLSPETFVSNGPFLLHSWKHSDCMAFKKNNRYWESDSVKLSGVDFFIAPPDTALRMYEEGQLDWTGSPLSNIPPDAIKNMIASHRLQVSPFLATYFYRINTASQIGGKDNPLADLNFRKALACSIDRKGIVNYVLQGGQTPARSLVPPEMALNPKGYFSDCKLENPRQIQEPITISYSNTERNATVAQAVQKQWESVLGIKVQLEAVEPKVFFQRVSKKEYQIAAGSWTADFNDPVNFLEVFKYKDGSTNNTGWEHPEYIDLLNQSPICDKAKRTELLRKAEEILMEEMPIIPVFHFALNYIKKPELSGVVLSPMGQLDLRWAYFEPSSPTKGAR